jgi:multidrug efflux pump subunit AcrB
MTAAQVSFDDIIGAVSRENTTISGGNVVNNGIKKNIRVVGEIENPAELEDVVVKKQDGVVYLKDIATIKFQPKEATTHAREYGNAVVMLDVKKRSGKNMIEATESIKQIVKEAQDNYFPSNLKISMANDQSSRTINQVDDLVNNIIFGSYVYVVHYFSFIWSNFKYDGIICLSNGTRNAS